MLKVTILFRKSITIIECPHISPGGVYLKKFYTGRFRPEVQPLTLLLRKGTPFVYLLLEKGTPFIYLLKKTYE